jgi:hypothetical protein
MKYLLPFFAVSLSALLLPHKALACDPIGCFLTGKDQNVVALVEVTSLSSEDITANPYYTFPMNIIKVPGPLHIRNFPKDRDAQVGDRYLVSLQCEKKDCSIAWGIWAVTGNTLETTKLETIRFGDDAIIQTYISSGGTLTDYYSRGDKTYLRTPSAGDMEIYPNIPEQFPGPDFFNIQLLAGILLIVGGVLYFIWRKGSQIKK